MLAGYWIKNVSGAKILKGTKELTQTTDARQSIVSLNTIKCFSIFDFFYFHLKSRSNPAHGVLFVIYRDELFVHFRWTLKFRKICPFGNKIQTFLEYFSTFLSDDSEYYSGVCDHVWPVCSWICGLVVRIWFFCNLVTRCLIGRLHLWANSTNQITWFQSSINVKFLKRETKSSSADCHDDDLFYIPMFYLPFFLIFRIMHPPVIYRDHKIFLKLI